MFKLVEVRPYEGRRGHRFVFQAQQDLFLRGNGGHLVFVPKGGHVEVSLIQIPPHLGGLEAAVIYQNTYIAIYRGLLLTAEKALSKTLA